MLLDNLKDLERHIFLQKGNDLAWFYVHIYAMRSNFAY